MTCWTSIGSDNGLVLIRRQAILWTNADPITDALGGDELDSSFGTCSPLPASNLPKRGLSATKTSPKFQVLVVTKVHIVPNEY